MPQESLHWLICIFFPVFTNPIRNYRKTLLGAYLGNKSRARHRSNLPGIHYHDYHDLFNQLIPSCYYLLGVVIQALDLVMVILTTHSTSSYITSLLPILI